MKPYPCYPLPGPPNCANACLFYFLTGICPGLENLGSTCFLNAILQAWATSSMVDWLSDFLKKQPQAKAKNCLASPLLTCLKGKTIVQIQSIYKTDFSD